MFLVASRLSVRVAVQPRLSAAVAEVPTPECAKLFGRLAEPILYLDAAVGQCCHSACDDCEFRLPDGGYRFDMLKSTKPKWVPCYTHRDFADERGSHTPRWVSALFPDGAPLAREAFGDRCAPPPSPPRHATPHAATR